MSRRARDPEPVPEPEPAPEPDPEPERKPAKAKDRGDPWKEPCPVCGLVGCRRHA